MFYSYLEIENKLNPNKVAATEWVKLREKFYTFQLQNKNACSDNLTL